MFLVFDMTNEHSLKSIEYWYNLTVSLAPQHVKIILLGNKCDLMHEISQGIETKLRLQIKVFLNKYNFLQYVECSAKDDHNIKSTFKDLYSFLYANMKDRLRQNFSRNQYKLKNKRYEKDKSNCC